MAQPVDLRALARRESFEPQLVRLARGDVLRVGASVLDHLAVVQVQHARDRGVEQIEVVTHHQQRAAVLAEEADEPFLRVVVEVVGRLVEQQQLAAREQDPRELDPAALTTGERVDGKVEPTVGEPEPGRDAPHLGLGLVPAGVAELLFGAGELGHVPLVRVFFDPEPELLDPLGLGVEVAAGEHVGETGVVHPRAPGLGVLGQVAEGVGTEHHTAGGFAFSGDDLEHRGLAGAVAPDQSHLVAGAQLEGGTLEGDPAPDLDSEVADLQHRAIVPRAGPPARLVCEPFSQGYHGLLTSNLRFTSGRIRRRRPR